MHELSVAQNIVDIVKEHVPEVALPQVLSVSVRIGEFSGVVPESLLMCYDVVKAECGLMNSGLIIEQVEFIVRCTACGAVERNEIGTVLCPRCSSPHTNIVSGTELLVSAIELKEPESEVS